MAIGPDVDKGTVGRRGETTLGIPLEALPPEAAWQGNATLHLGLQGQQAMQKAGRMWTWQGN